MVRYCLYSQFSCSTSTPPSSLLVVIDNDGWFGWVTSIKWKERNGRAHRLLKLNFKLVRRRYVFRHADSFSDFVRCNCGWLSGYRLPHNQFGLDTCLFHEAVLLIFCCVENNVASRDPEWPHLFSSSFFRCFNSINPIWGRARKRKSISNLVLKKIISVYKHVYQHFQGDTKIWPKVSDRPPRQNKAVVEPTTNDY
jgi:hypothetical protein